MNILLTGASGLLGAHLLEVGLNLGHSFKAISRKVSKRSFLSTVLEREEIEWIEADLTNQESWPQDLFKDVDLVINCGGLASPFLEDQDKMRELNITATKNLFELAKKSGIKEWVQISSVSTLSDGSTDMVNESHIGSFRKTPYAESKFEIDQWLETQNDMSLLTIHPCYMLGKWDARPSSGSLILAMRMGKFKYFIEGNKNFVSPTDVAMGTFKAIEKSCSGHYVLGGENRSIKEFATEVIKKLNLELDNFSFYSKEGFSKIELSEREKCIVAEFCQASSVDIAKAKKDFGYDPKMTFSQQLEEAIDFFLEKRLLRIKK
ncbi:hypothetical protein A9Q84_19085 [Halobacteriovorax marinus]|uniref:NAD-dependent epimerase/dehydratase domain-containing protein n=1 Tax=Halobacteriovorax marinus TaxID=97084 RepID=A0A1Y5F2E1_9BACT|nr:hypothetical protein A9Q84_19085 [Halobacteriovorax marinus]